MDLDIHLDLPAVTLVVSLALLEEVAEGTSSWWSALVLTSLEPDGTLDLLHH